MRVSGRCFLLFGPVLIIIHPTDAFLVSPSRRTTAAATMPTNIINNSIFPPQQRSLFLDVSVKSDDEVDDQNNNDNKRLARDYKIARYLFGATAAILLVMPDRTMSVLLASKLGGAAGFGLAAGLSYILGTATVSQHSHIGSDTHKRLNCGLLGFCVLGLVAVPGEAGFFRTAVPAMVLSALMFWIRIFGATVAWRGWRKGVSSATTPKLIVDELVGGAKSNIRGLRVRDRKKALTYRNVVLLLSLGILSSFMDGLFNIRVRTTVSALLRPHSFCLFQQF